MLNHVSSNVSTIANSLRQYLPFPSQQDHDITPYYANHVAAITGAGSGMGRELTSQLPRMGDHLTSSDINPEQSAHTKEILVDDDVKVSTTVLNVSDNKDAEAWAYNVMTEQSKV